MEPAELRREYRSVGIDPDALGPDPFAAFGAWMATAGEFLGDDANAMIVATADPSTGRPSIRNVLLKGVERDRFTWYSNRLSRKGREIAANPEATILFSWVPVDRQLVVEGRVELVSDAVSDAYWLTRPRGSQIAAWASPQSQPIADRDELVARAAEVADEHADRSIPRPPNWGGFVLTADRYEFWQGRENRLHDRFEFVRQGDGWVRRRLAP